MFSRLIGFIFFVTFLYIVLLFVAPNIADQYGDRELNAKIRNIKDQSLQFASGSDSPASLMDKIKTTATPYLENTKQAVGELNTTVTQKVNQVQEASDAIQNAYSGIVDATHKIQNLTGTGK